MFLERRCRSVGGSRRDFIGREASISRGTASSRIGERARVDISRDDTCRLRRGMPLSSNDPCNSCVTRTPNCSIKAPPCLTRRIFRTRDRARIIILHLRFLWKMNRSIFLFFSSRIFKSVFLFFSFFETNRSEEVQSEKIDNGFCINLLTPICHETLLLLAGPILLPLWYEKFLPRSLVTTAPC